MAVFASVPQYRPSGPTLNLEKMNETRVLVVGGGGREHAIVDALSRSQNVSKIYCAPGNAGIAFQAECVPIKDNDIDGLLSFAKEKHISLTIIGPEVPLSMGIVDSFTVAGLRIFGPSAAAARIESSKDFAKKLMDKYGIPTAAHKTFESYDKAIAYVEAGLLPVVLKYDGLAAGKGVIIARTLLEAKTALKEMLLDGKFGRGKVVIEEFLTGPEFSYMCLVNGPEVFPLALAQDHKRAYDGDQGPNTGGMGAYSPLPFISKDDEVFALNEIMKKTASAMVSEGCPFKGLLYGGLMKTPEGIKVIEFNCRFGDPETEVVLPRLDSDIYELFSAIADGHFPGEKPSGEAIREGTFLTAGELMPPIKWRGSATMGFVMASKGYPGSYRKGYEIKGLEFALEDPSARIYHMGTSIEDGKLVTSGGRVMMVVGEGSSLRDAHDVALAAVRKIDCDNLFHRSDIGGKVL